CARWYGSSYYFDYW
nr:immunoglobulin heavy chain junction region [Mus musculus]NSM05885.1 immunoglobulin heavy chain junction region [Mus musculus]NSM06697.1 immunoglobulin heavy chain junction region [Mus musculus]